MANRIIENKNGKRIKTKDDNLDAPKNISNDSSIWNAIKTNNQNKFKQFNFVFLPL
mgnify:CR=1 FL=1